MKQLTAFTWGYWGWGNHTNEFVRIVDAIERDRGRRPPLFVDIRFSRSVRAVGFRQDAFEHVTGQRRYRWMRALGNSRIGSGKGGMKIFDPRAADNLLDLIIAADRQNRRVLFFCACEYPRYCHRTRVANLVRIAATRRGVHLTTIEWPGGEPITAQLRVTENVLNEVLRGYPCAVTSIARKTAEDTCCVTLVLAGQALFDRRHSAHHCRTSKVGEGLVPPHPWPKDQ
jgi:Domain of unknown function DUF488